jgi:xanthine dehydrogenase accessory factor
MDAELLKVLQKAMEENRAAVVASVVKSEGSAPRGAGAKMIIFKDGRTFGTVGGGAVEKRVMEEARSMKKAGETRLLSFNLVKDLGMGCGGEMTLFLESIRGLRRLVIFGGGHIGLALYTLSPLLGMAPVIVDERPDYCHTERFPGAECLSTLPEEALSRLDLDRRDHVVIVTHRHLRDLECLRLVINRPVGYVGMIGSRSKVAKTLNQLREEGVDEATIARVRAPIGLNLGGRTPGEIAVAIAAEIIACLHGGRPDGFGW